GGRRRGGIVGRWTTSLTSPVRSPRSKPPPGSRWARSPPRPSRPARAGGVGRRLPAGPLFRPGPAALALADPRPRPVIVVVVTAPTFFGGRCHNHHKPGGCPGWVVRPGRRGRGGGRGRGTRRARPPPVGGS